jgi:hypothetical protein
MLKGASSPAIGKIAGAVGVVLLPVAALGVVVQPKDALNTIWQTKEPESAGVWWYLRTYLISFAGVLFPASHVSGREHRPFGLFDLARRRPITGLGAA